MLSLLLLLPLAVCNSTFTCAVACEKNDVAACTWLAREIGDRHAAAKACALDDTACDELARLLLISAREQDVAEVAARLAPKCHKGDMATCAQIVERAWGMGRVSSQPLASSTRAVTETYCSTAVPPLCADDDLTCDGWGHPLRLCAAAATGLNEPKLVEGVWARALAACRQNASACVDLLVRAAERMDNATTSKLKAEESKRFGELVQNALPACRKPDDRACRSLRALDLSDLPSLATVVATKRCTVEGGRVCREQHERVCDGGKGPLASCLDAVLALGSDEFDSTGSVSKKLVEACIKDNPRACFAVGVMGAGQRFLVRDILTSDEAFAKACKLKHKAACRATVKPQAIVEPRAIPGDAVHPSEEVSVHVRAPGDGAAIGALFLVEEWTWNIDGDGEAEHERAVVATGESGFGRRRRVELGGLKEGADVIVWDTVSGTIKRTVVLTNIGP